MFLFNNPPCFIPEKYAADMETDFNPYNFADPGNNNPRQQSEKNAVDSEKGNCGNAENVTEYQQKKAHSKSPVTKRGNIAGQTIHISRQSQGDGIAVKFRKEYFSDKKTYGCQKQEHKNSYRFFI